MKKYKILIAYDGLNYSGWQIQKNTLSIQGVIEKALSTVLKETIQITASGRTDAKVHAIEQAAHFITKNELNADKIIYSLNSLLPKDIRILKIEKVDLSFHARFSAKSKIYQYHIVKNEIVLPFDRFYVYKPNHKLDLSLMKKAIKYFLGTQDFSAFANVGSNKASPIKTIYRIDIIETENKIILEFEGSGFLYKMVRNIVGTLLDVSQKKISPESIRDILDSKNIKLASAPVPAYGLFLIKINY